ncbi:WG repeat-containing protein [Pedobacter sp. PAMC26386]|nr:WG repeat-containing protein [Pedobacter sp. PAMC26386]
MLHAVLLMVSNNEIKDGELYGYKTRGGKIAIPAKFNSVDTDKFYKMTIVLWKYEWVGIDRKEGVVLRPFHFVEGGEMGFADLNGDRIIPATFDFVYPFKDGLADYVIGGRNER